ncbi:hypothetical protein TCAL_15827, partial [Tigriopus californicus]
MALTDEIMGSLCIDSLKVTSSSNEPIPEICGQNSGQHIYVDMDRGCSGNAKLDFSFTGEASTRIFEIKATQIECGSRSAYSICIRQELGYCCVQYRSSSACRQSGVPSTVFSRYCGQKLNDFAKATLHTPIC